MEKTAKTDEFITTDVLVIGGGAAGYRAAIKAIEGGCNTVLIDKTAVRAAGCLGFCCGMEHFSYIYPPPGTPLHNPNLSLPPIEEIIAQIDNLRGTKEQRMFLNPSSTFSIIVTEGWDEVLELERIGVRFKEDDGSYFVIYMPAQGMIVALFKGEGIQHKFAAELSKRGVKVFNRTMAVDLLTHDGVVSGAVALDVRTGNVKVLQSKATVLATGSASRSYLTDPLLLSNPFVSQNPPVAAGSNAAMGYRAGAEIINSEFAWICLGTKNGRVPLNGLAPFALWPSDVPQPHPRLINAKGEEIFPEGKFKDRIAGSFHAGFLPLLGEEERKGNSPFFWDCRHLPEEMIQYIEQRSFAQEGPIALKWLRERGIDLRKDLIEVTLRFFGLHAGVLIDENAQTNLRGLYAAGDATSNTGGALTAALVFGKRAGINAAKYALEAREASIDETQVERIKECILALQMVKDGYEPLEVEKEVRSVVTRYSGFYKSATTLERALEVISDLKATILPRVSAKNPHELMRALEVRNIILTIELHLRASLERKESRMGGFGHYHLRRDYPETDPNWDKLLVIQKEDEDMKFMIRDC